MKEKLADALNEISESYIAEAANVKKRHHRAFLSAVAAVLIISFLFNMPNFSIALNARAVSTASESRVGHRPEYGTEKWEAWNAARNLRQQTTEEAVPVLTPFFRESTALYISGSNENRVWSPVNGCIALAMLAEVTEGNSRQQILDTLGIGDLETLRAYVSAIWETVYKDDGNEISALANSLWLDTGLDYNQETMDNLSYYHYASVYQTDLSSRRAGKALAAWLDENTGGLLTEYTAGTAFPEEAVLTLASTVYLQTKWVDEFSKSNNTQGIFHSPGGDVDVTYMNRKEHQTYYYWGESYGAVALYLKTGGQMWFFLPDPDKTVDDILKEGQYLTTLTQAEVYEDTEGKKYMKVNLTVPKFDIFSGGNLAEMFQALGISDVFHMDTANFSAITSEVPVFLSAVNQAARVIIDEQGVKAASYIELPACGAAAPPEEIIDFILDRPFLFVIATDQGIPLFTGVVNQP